MSPCSDRMHPILSLFYLIISKALKVSIRIEACPQLRPKFPPHQREADQSGGNAIVHRLKCCDQKQKQPNINRNSLKETETETIISCLKQKQVKKTAIS